MTIFSKIIVWALFLFFQTVPPQELVFKAMYQFENRDNRRLDLSGLVVVNDVVYMVGDKDYDHYIYEIVFTENSFYTHKKNELYFDRVRELEEIRLDLEGIDYCKDRFYLINETTNEVIAITGEQVFTIPIDYEAFGENPRTWLKNAGYEGVAINCDKNILYLAKERQPRFIYEVDLDGGLIISKFNIPETESNDFAAMEYENGFLYLLERNGNYIAKVDAETKEVVAKVSYRQVCSHPDGKLYEPSKYGMAEALWLNDKEIWVGIDNNGISLSYHAINKYGLSGSTPVFIKFDRPAGF
jgi:hypothetical protein